MTRFVVDASVVVKWFVPEIHAGAAQGLLREGLHLFSPDLVRAEAGNVLWKKWRRGQMSAETVEKILQDFGDLGLKIESSAPLMNTAWDVARRFDRSFHDGLYMALAVEKDCALVTADRKLYNALSGSDLDEHVVWVEDLDSTETGEGPR